jgi:hypothetical protein
MLAVDQENTGSSEKRPDGILHPVAISLSSFVVFAGHRCSSQGIIQKRPVLSRVASGVVGNLVGGDYVAPYWRIQRWAEQ